MNGDTPFACVKCSGHAQMEAMLSSEQSLTSAKNGLSKILQRVANPNECHVYCISPSTFTCVGFLLLSDMTEPHDFAGVSEHRFLRACLPVPCSPWLPFFPLPPTCLPLALRLAVGVLGPIPKYFLYPSATWLHWFSACFQLRSAVALSVNSFLAPMVSWQGIR